MKKLKLYLDTSIINYLFAEDTPEKQKTTQEFFENFVVKERFNVYISDVVIEEIERTADGLIGEKGGNNMMPFEKCSICGGELVKKEVEKLLKGGNHIAVINIHAEVCLHCGERFYSQEAVCRFEEIRAKLKRQELESFQPLGQSFQVV